MRSRAVILPAVVLALDGALGPGVERLLLALLELLEALAHGVVHRALRLQGGLGDAWPTGA